MRHAAAEQVVFPDARHPQARDRSRSGRALRIDSRVLARSTRARPFARDLGGNRVKPSSPSRSPVSAPVLDFLGRRRRVLIAAYLLFLTGAFAFTLTVELPLAPEILHTLRGDNPDPNVIEPGSDCWVAVGAFLVLQALFLWGGALLYVSQPRTRLIKLVFPVLIGSAFFTLLLVFFLTSFLEMTDRLNSEGSIRESALLFDNDSDSNPLQLVFVVWAF